MTMLIPVLEPALLVSPLGKAEVLIEALPYIQRFSGKIFVVKYGGSLLENPTVRAHVLQDLALLKQVGIQPILVHGGGPAMNAMLGQLNKETRFIQGHRITDEETLNVAEMVLSGKINKSLVSGLQQQGVRAVGISGQDGGTMMVKKRFMKGHYQDIDMGFEGEVTQINTHLLQTLMDASCIPVISPIGMDEDGQAYNMDGDVVAMALAKALQAEKLVFLTAAPGVLSNAQDPDSLISVLSVGEAQTCLEEQMILGGMAAKVKSCIDAVQNGVGSVHILDGRNPHALLLEIFTAQGMGTMVIDQR
jgi:acetylglutamate kinase